VGLKEVEISKGYPTLCQELPGGLVDTFWPKEILSQGCPIVRKASITCNFFKNLPKK
jgi:hypothetical protein